MSAALRVAHAAETIRARWELRTVDSPQVEAAQALEDTGQLLDPEVAAELKRLRVRATALDYQGPGEHETVEEAAQMYRSLRPVIERTMVEPDRWDGDEDESFHLGRYVEWLASRVSELENERHSTNESLSEAAEQLRVDRDRIAQLEALAASATEYRIWEPGYGLYVRRSPGATGFAILESRRTDQGRRAWTKAGLRYTVALSEAELFCWPDAEAAVSEARRVLPGAVVREDEPAETGGAR